MAKRQAAAEERARDKIRAENPDDPVRLALALSLHPDDPAAAAAYAGVVADPELMERTLRAYRDLTDPGNMAPVLGMMRAAAAMCAHYAYQRASLLSPAQAASSAQAMARAVDVLRGDQGQAQSYSQITITLPEGYGAAPATVAN